MHFGMYFCNFKRHYDSRIAMTMTPHVFRSTWTISASLSSWSSVSVRGCLCGSMFQRRRTAQLQRSLQSFRGCTAKPHPLWRPHPPLRLLTDWRRHSQQLTSGHSVLKRTPLALDSDMFYFAILNMNSFC